MEDPIVNEVHEARCRIFNECGEEIERLIERLRLGNDKNADRLVTLEEVERRRDGRIAASRGQS